MKKILLSTTSQLSGWEIVDYIDVISSQVVIGTGIFSDLFAGVTDTLGGNSNSYEKQLKNITSTALNRLKKTAESLDANAVVGVNLDYDEISGKGKQMFMLTATGTAVFAKKANSIIELENRLENIIDEDLAYGKVEGLPLIKIKMDKLIKLLDTESYIPDELNEKLFQYYRIVGSYSRAEDLLYNMIDSSTCIEEKKRLTEEGILFYKNILNKTDEELEHGNLPRNEVLDGINTLCKLVLKYTK